MTEKLLYGSLGFKRVINAAGHFTVLGGSCPSPRVVEAMDAAAGHWVDMHALEANAGRLLSSRLGCEDGLVTSGAYAANTIAAHTALSIARERRRAAGGGGGADRTDDDDNDNNILIQSSHVTKYAESYAVGGVRLKKVSRRSGSENLSEHIDRSTIAVAYVLGESDLEFDLRETVDACAQANIPVLVDAAVVDPPVRGVKEVLKYGPDAVSVSGGKGFNGPNASGILVGRAGFISRARALAFPNYGPGRAMKVSKEQVAGLAVAVEQAVDADEQKLVEGWLKRAERVKEMLQGVPHVRAEVLFPWHLNFPQPIPRVGVFIETVDGESKAEEVRGGLRDGSPSIVTRPGGDVTRAKNAIIVEVRTLKEREVGVVGETMRVHLLKAMRRPRAGKL